MYSWNDPDDRVTIARMNTELRDVQLDLLSARCSTDRLRERFSVKALAQYAEKEVLRKMIGHATALSDYYVSIEKEIPGQTPALDESQLADAIELVAQYLREQRDRHSRESRRLSPQHTRIFQPFFSSALLEEVRYLELRGRRVPPPSFYQEAKALGLANLPDLTHMTSLTFVDIIVFNEQLSERGFFHGLVHAAQFRILGLERYTELFVRGFLRTMAHFNVPLETQAFALESRFATHPERHFSVEEQIQLWVREQRY
jgi:hypothetical protein